MALTLNNFSGFETGGNEEADATVGAPTYNESVQRSGDYCLEMDSTDRWTIDPFEDVANAGADQVVGFYVRFAHLGPTSTRTFFAAQSSTTPLFTLAISSTGGDLIVGYNTGSTNTVSGPFVIDQWYHIEVFWQNSASGNLILHIDGVEALSVSGKDMITGAQDVNEYSFTSGTTTGSTFFDDFYSLSGASGVSDFLGATQVFCYQCNTNSATGDSGKTLDAGVWQSIGQTPSNADEVKYTGAVGEGYNFADDTVSGNNYRPGPDGGVPTIDGTVKGAKWFHQMKRSNGPTTVFYKRFGNNVDVVASPGEVVVLTTSFKDFVHITEGSLVPLKDEVFALGFGKDAGTRDLVCKEVWGFLLHQEKAGQSIVRAFDEDVDIADDVVFIEGFVHVVDEVEEIADAAETHRTLQSQVVDEVEEIADDVEVHLKLKTIVDEVEEIVEGAEAHLSLVVVVDEDVDIADDVVPVQGHVEVVDEDVDIADAVVALISTGIFHDNTTTAKDPSTSSLIISSHVVQGTDPVLIVKVGVEHTSTTVNTVVWDEAGVNESLTQLDSKRQDDALAEIWYLANPTAKTADVKISLSGVRTVIAAASTYNLVHQTSPFRTAAKASAGASTDTPTVDVVALDGEMVVDSMSQSSEGPDTATADHTEIHNVEEVSAFNDLVNASQEKASSGATETMSWSMSAVDDWAIVAAPLQPPGAGTAFVRVVDETVNIVDAVEDHRATVEVVDEVEEIGEGVEAHRATVEVVDEVEEIAEGVEAHRATVVVDDDVEQVSEEVLIILGIVKVVDEVEEVADAAETHRATVEVVDEVEEIADDSVRARTLVRITDEVEEIAEGAEAHRATVEVVDEVEEIAEGAEAHRATVEVVDEVEEIADDVVSSKGFVKVIDEVEEIADAVEAHRTLQPLVVDEVEEVGEGSVRVRTLVLVVDEVEQVGEGAEAHRATVEIVDEVEEIADGVVSSKGFVKVVDEVEEIAEGAEAHRATVKVVDEVEEIAEGAEAHRATVEIIDEVEEVGEGAEAHRATVEIVDEVEQIAEDIVDVLTVGGVSFVEVVDEVEQIADAVEAHRATVKIVDEVEQIAEGSVRVRTLVLVVDEVEEVGDGSVRARTLVRVTDEVEEIADDTVEKLTLPGLLTQLVNEDINIADSALPIKGLTEVVDEGIDIADASEVHRRLVRAIDEVEEIADSALSVKGLIEVVDEVEQIADAVEGHRALGKVVDEVEEIADGSVRARALIRVEDEVEEIGEGALTLRSIVQVVDETENIGEGILDFINTSILTQIIDETEQLVEGIVTQLHGPINLVVGETIELAELTRPLSKGGPGPHIEFGSAFPSETYPRSLFFRTDLEQLHMRNSDNTAWLVVGP